MSMDCQETKVVALLFMVSVFLYLRNDRSDPSPATCG